MLMSALQNLAWHGTCWATMWSRRNHRESSQWLESTISFLFLFFLNYCHIVRYTNDGATCSWKPCKQQQELFCPTQSCYSRWFREDLLWWVPWDFSFFHVGDQHFELIWFWKFLLYIIYVIKLRRLAQQSLWVSWFLTRASTWKEFEMVVEEEPPRPASSKGDPGDQDEWGAAMGKGARDRDEKKDAAGCVLDKKACGEGQQHNHQRHHDQSWWEETSPWLAQQVCSGFNFFFPFTCSHLYLLMTRLPMAALQPTCTASKSQSMPNKKHCRQERRFNSRENVLHVSIKLPSLLSVACQPCLAKNIVWPLANDFFWPLVSLFFNP